MRLIGATILAVVIYFVLSFGSAYWLSGPNVTATSAFLSAILKTALFGVLFHYAHWYAARLFNWYRPEDRGEAVPPPAKPDDTLADIDNI